MLRRIFTGAVVLPGLIGLIVSDTQAVVNYETRALTGQPATGAEPGEVYNDFSAGVIGAGGQVAFFGFLSGPTVSGSNDMGIWSDGSGSLELIARENSAAPGTESGVVFYAMTNLIINGSGQTAFRSVVRGPGIDTRNNHGIWSEGSGPLALVVRDGDLMPGAEPGVVLSGLGTRPVFNGAGQTAFYGQTIAPGETHTDAGIWSEGSGSLDLVARIGMQAPGTGPGVTYSDFVDTPMLNDAGQTAFIARLGGPGVDGTNNRGIWSEGGDTLHLIVRTGEQAAGTAAGVVYNDFSSPRLNGSGQTAVKGFLAGPGIDTSNEQGLWSEGSGSLSLIAQGGDAAPGTGPWVVFSTFRSSPLINDDGLVAFIGELTGSGVDTTNDQGAWVGDKDALNLVVRTGDAAPGAAPGVTFDNLGGFVVNGFGQIAFHAGLTGLGVVDTNDRGIFATDRYGMLQMIAREGDLFDVNDDPLIDDLRTISLILQITGSGGGDGYPNSFNDAGQIVFALQFTDGTSGVFVATVPEPGVVALLLTGLPWILYRSKPAH